MKALVTGANGHLGNTLVRQLQARGHAVRASVRGARDPAKTAPLRDLKGLDIVTADLADGQALRAAMDGIDIVFHVAAIFDLDPANAQAVLAASLDGVSNVFAAARDQNVARIVLTSSIVALPMVADDAVAPVDETQWNTALDVPYIRAKTEGEQRAWELARDMRLDLATVLPGAIGGPGFARKTPSLELIEAISNGMMQLAAPPVQFPYVDVRDVARAHILAGETGAQGRFLVTNTPVPMVGDVASAMASIRPRLREPMVTLPRATMPWLSRLDWVGSRLTGQPRALTSDMAANLASGRYHVTTRRAREVLGWRPEIAMADSLGETVIALRNLQRQRRRS